METKYKVMIGIAIVLVIALVIYLVYRKNKKDKLIRANELLVQYADTVNSGDTVKRASITQELAALGFTVVPNITTGKLELLDSDKKVVGSIG